MDMDHVFKQFKIINFISNIENLVLWARSE